MKQSAISAQLARPMSIDAFVHEQGAVNERSTRLFLSQGAVNEAFQKSFVVMQATISHQAKELRQLRSRLDDLTNQPLSTQVINVSIPERKAAVSTTETKVDRNAAMEVVRTVARTTFDAETGFEGSVTLP